MRIFSRVLLNFAAIFSMHFFFLSPFAIAHHVDEHTIEIELESLNRALINLIGQGGMDSRRQIETNLNRRNDLLIKLAENHPKLAAKLISKLSLSAEIHQRIANSAPGLEKKIERHERQRGLLKLLGVAVREELREKYPGSQFHLALKTGESYVVLMAPELEKIFGVQVGAQIDIPGINVPGKSGRSSFFVASAGPAAAEGTGIQAGSITNMRSVVGERKIAIMLINFKDNPYTFPVSLVASKFFSDPLSVAAYYNETSGGQLNLGGDVLGTFTVPFNSSGTCEYQAWASAADQAASNSGIDMSAYANKVYLFPYNNPTTGIKVGGCPAGGSTGGWAFIGYNQSWVGTVAKTDSSLYNWSSIQQVTSHELGHSFGVHHANSLSCSSGRAIDSYSACTNLEYGDKTDVMGGTTYQMNTPHKVALGWLSSQNILTVSANGTYQITASEIFDSSIKALRIRKPDTNEYYYVSYRRPIGYFDKNISSNGMSSVHVWNESPGTQTKILTRAPLGDGMHFEDPTNGIMITQLSHDTTSMTVSVNFGPIPCIRYPAIFSLTNTTWTPKVNPGYSLTNQALSIFNNDTISCAPSEFSLSSALPFGWSQNEGSVSVSSGVSVVYPLKIAVPVNTAIGNYSFSEFLSQVQNPGVSSSTNGVVQVVANDIVPPNGPNTLILSSPTGSSATLNWLQASDNSGVIAGYILRRCRAEIGINECVEFNTQATSYTDASVVNGASYQYFITSLDPSSNRSQAIGRVNWTAGTKVDDNLGPTISIVSPANGATVSGLVSFQLQQYDNVGIYKHAFFVDGQWANFGGIATYGSEPDTSSIFTWASSSWINGPHEITIIAYDKAGNLSNSASVLLNLQTGTDVILPAISFMSPVNGQTVSGSVLIQFNATDASGIKAASLEIDGVVHANASSYSWDSRQVANGSHLVKANVTDMAGNMNSTAITVNVANIVPDTLAPTASIITPLSGTKVGGGKLSVSAKATDNVGVVKIELYVNGQLFSLASTSTATFSIATRKLMSGNNNLQIKAYDAAGNVGASSIVYVTK